ncbi:MAG: isoprenylcysteine carboxylmethyltransferase family protein, partial [Thermoanaerobaculales bacterium]
VAISLRKLRLRSAWLLILPFFYFASPTPGPMAMGVALSALGLVVRAWAAGTIHKDRVLTTGGPYSYTRNPLYLGSLFLGFGVVVAGGMVWFAALFTGFYALVYGVTMGVERRGLEALFGDSYREYSERVPALMPRPTPYRGATRGETSFSVDRYRRNKEWEAFLGSAAGFGLLAAKMIWLP